MDKEKQLRVRLTKSNEAYVLTIADDMDITMSSAMNEIIREARASSKDTNDNHTKTVHLSME